MLFMAGDDPLRFPSFWRLPIIGGVLLLCGCAVACIPDVVKRPGVLGDTGILVVFTFPGSFVVHPICRSLLRHSPSRLAFGLKMSAWSLIVGTVGAGAAELVSLNFDKFDWPDLAADSSLSISNFTT
jgi:hypothetical protein